MVAEQAAGRWRIIEGEDSTPDTARARAARYFCKAAAGTGDGREHSALQQAALLQDVAPRDEMTAAGRRLRVVRVSQVIQIGPGGPQAPRPAERTWRYTGTGLAWTAGRRSGREPGNRQPISRV